MIPMLTPMLPPGSYADARAAFRWPVTGAMNMVSEPVRTWEPMTVRCLSTPS